MAYNHYYAAGDAGLRQFWRWPLLAALLLPLFFSGAWTFDSGVFLLFHAILEILSICISIMIFVLGWNSYPSKKLSNIAIFSTFFLSVAILDCLHALSYQGMPGFITPSSPGKAIWFYLAARIISGCAFLFMVVTQNHTTWQPRTRYWFLVLQLLISGLVFWVVVYHYDKLPSTYEDQTGLTSFKIIIEYMICALYIFTGIFCAWRWQLQLNFRIKLYLLALYLMTISELFFTIYASVFDMTNFAGHIYKLSGYTLIYVAVFWDRVHNPYIILQRSEEELQASQKKLLTTLHSIAEPILITDQRGTINFMNSASISILGVELTDIQSKPYVLTEVFALHEAISLEKTLLLMKPVTGLEATLKNSYMSQSVPIEYGISPITDKDNELIGLVVVFRDVTARHEETETKNRLISILENATDFVATFSKEGTVHYLNPAAKQLLRLDKNDESAKLLISSLHPEWASQTVQEACQSAERMGAWRGETAIIDSHGHEIPVSQVLVAHLTRSGDSEYFSTIMRNITDRKNAEKRQQMAIAIFGSISEGVMVTDPQGSIIYVNPSFTQITGYSEQEAFGKNPSLISSGWHTKDFYKAMWEQITGQGIWQGEIWNKHKNGEVYLEKITISRVCGSDGQLLYYVGVLTDITLQKQLETKIKYQAHHDIVTGLPNRILLHDRIEQAIGLANRNQTHVAVLFLDLDRFKRINDTLGHAHGDLLLKTVADRICSMIRASDTAARIGGDEFVVLLPDLKEADDSKVIAEKLISGISKPVHYMGQEFYVTVSIGISIYPQDGLSADTLIKHADHTMYLVKNEGRNHYLLHSQANHRSMESELNLENELRKAIEANQFELHYQPKIMTNTGRVAGLEALIRWHHPAYGLIPPSRFIPLAEETGLIIELDKWVIRQVASRYAILTESFHSPLRVSINMSMLLFRDESLPEYISEVLRETGCPAHNLEIELTESTLMSHLELTLSNLHQLKDMGIRISLDDFGTGYSSLNYLKRLPIQTLKIDQSFVKDINSDSENRVIVKTIINLAHNLNMDVVAEGVEDEVQLAFLKEHQCEQIQGYYYSPPLSEPEVLEFVYKQNRIS